MRCVRMKGVLLLALFAYRVLVFCAVLDMLAHVNGRLAISGWRRQLILWCRLIEGLWATLSSIPAAGLFENEMRGALNGAEGSCGAIHNDDKKLNSHLLQRKVKGFCC